MIIYNTFKIWYNNKKVRISDMRCKNRNCNREIGDFPFCPWCGKEQNSSKKDVKRPKRANGTGSVYKRKDNKSNPYGAMSSSTRGERVFIGNYPTKYDAIKALEQYESNSITNPNANRNVTIEYIYLNYVEQSIETLSESAQKSARMAWTRLRTIHKVKIKDLRTNDLQKIIDFYAHKHQKTDSRGNLYYIDSKGKETTEKTNTPKMQKPLSKGTLEQIKILLSKIYKVAEANDWVVKNYSAFINITTPTEKKNNKSRFTEKDLANFKEHLEEYEYLDYVLCLCYLNFRISEFLELTIDSYHISEDGIPYFQAGKKTTAGSNRIIPIHPQIQPLVNRCIDRNGKTIFCDKETLKQMKQSNFRYRFDKLMQSFGFGLEYTPHSCRRTFSTRMSATGVSDADLTALMGHTNIDVDINYYINQEVKTLYNAVSKMD